MLVNVFDTSVSSDNLGDEIIMDSVWNNIAPLFPNASFVKTASHRYPTLSDLRTNSRAKLSIVGGTNILKSHMLVRGNWRITPLDYLVWRNVVLLGVGWQHYTGRTDALTRLFFHTVLSKTLLHSARDMYTYDQLAPLMPNVIYTACPTMWHLDEAACSRVPIRKARDAVFAVTYYRAAPEADRAIFDVLKRHYETVYLWPQQPRDVEYVKCLGLGGLKPIAESIPAFNDVLDTQDVDFIGARLHGGIRALQRGRRTLVLSVDNRAIELGRSTNLPVMGREDPAAIEAWITQPAPTRLELPWENIARWKGQFATTAYAGDAELRMAS